MKFDCFVYTETQQIADAAAKVVKVYYTDIQPPLVDIREAIRQKSFFTQNMPKETKIGDAASKCTQKHSVVFCMHHYFAFSPIHQCSKTPLTWCCLGS